MKKVLLFGKFNIRRYEIPNFFRFGYPQHDLYLIILILFLPIAANSQSLSISFGYHVRFAPDDIREGQIEDLSKDQRRLTMLKQSFGAGLNHNISYTHDISNSIQIGIELSLLESNQNTLTTRRLGFNNIKNEMIESTNALMLFVEPNLKIRANVGSSFVYGSLGPSIGLLGRIKERTNIISPEVSKSIYVLDRGMAWGLMANLGLSFRISKRVGWFVEHKVRVSSYAPRRGRLLKYTLSDTNLLPDLSKSEREVIYVNKRSTVENAPIDRTKPSTRLKVFYPFSSMGLQAGFIFKL